jgi:hypothetical protein
VGGVLAGLLKDGKRRVRLCLCSLFY